MYAIIETGGKQYRVEKGDLVDIELLEEKKEGLITFKNVLLLHDGSTARIGNPYVSNSSVTGELVKEVLGAKVVSYKYKQRKNYRRKVGHRQKYLKVKITNISG